MDPVQSPYLLDPRARMPRCTHAIKPCEPVAQSNTNTCKSNRPVAYWEYLDRQNRVQGGLRSESVVRPVAETEKRPPADQRLSAKQPTALPHASAPKLGEVTPVQSARSHALSLKYAAPQQSHRGLLDVMA